MLLNSSLIIFIVFISIYTNYVKCDDVESKAVFTIYTNSSSSGSTWEAGTSLSSYGCDTSSKLVLFTHGWGGDSDSPWVLVTVQNFLKHRGGCVIYLDYSACVNENDYFEALKKFDSVSAVITRKLHDIEDEEMSSDNIHLYGFSLGARLMIDAAINFGPKRIGSIDVCEPANLGFDKTYKKDPKDAAKNTQGIFTSSYAGSAIRDAYHQNWLMGNCGKSVPGTQDLSYILCMLTKKCNNKPTGSHSMCNDIYNSAFDNDFVATNANLCSGVTDSSSVPVDFKMGYKEGRKDIQGVFAAPTYADFPYNC